ncbi:MAG: hypothetical protein ACFE0I_19760 [Elainellaceae cyanobacterium]
MMQELSDLKTSILEERYTDALTIVDQLDGMSRRARIDAIESFLVRMMIHIVKNQLEKRLTNSWAASIRGSVVDIKKLNPRDNRTAYYINPDDWHPMLEDAMEIAIRDASVEVFDGNYSPFQLDEMVNRASVMAIAHHLISLTYLHPKRELPRAVDDYLMQLPGGEEWKRGSSQ